MHVALALLLLLPQHAPAAESPYKSLQTRSIKALSDEEIRGYREGAGMRLALPAELHGYPGPKHILELEKPLALTPEQKASIQQLYDRMHGEAVSIGTKVVELEKALDEAFRDSKIDAKRLSELTNEIAALQGRLRYTHLVTHIEAKGLLTRHQLHEYSRLRGYGEGHGHSHSH